MSKEEPIIFYDANMDLQPIFIHSKYMRAMEMMFGSKIYGWLQPIIPALNRMIRGWDNYFAIGYRKKAYSEVNNYLNLKLWKFCTRKSQRRKKLPQGEKWNSYLKKQGMNFLSYA